MNEGRGQSVFGGGRVAADVRWGMAALLVGVLASGRAQALTPAAEQAILSVHQAMQRERDAQTAAGPARDLAERLVRLGALNQAGRGVLHTSVAPGKCSQTARERQARRFGECELYELAIIRNWLLYNLSHMFL